MIKSPCVKVCQIDPNSGYCYACNRTMEEIIKWGLPETTDEWKKNNLEEIKTR